MLLRGLRGPHVAWMLLATVWALLVKRIDGPPLPFPEPH